MADLSLQVAQTPNDILKKKKKRSAVVLGWHVGNGGHASASAASLSYCPNGGITLSVLAQLSLAMRVKGALSGKPCRI
ncbi:hypothetical protein, unlikely [Trypanosoma brucei brucei TREU927]|uniref:Uncharacterized protein n=1 Tax=Trypanosoma brucei brucei (strain 927/4 GUTat10.1) TaxID=185431 RepID=Q4GZB1_TRYB2|nr:hypothetical protein, unlikely [Trypanosoma brucei brucei TREU927]CAJ16043.1 hypothetical protein, unlikely [Trypanosoma brucei brucei TREU927]